MKSACGGRIRGNMRSLSVFIELNGKQTRVGTIRGNHPDNARFFYAAEYKNNPDNRPVSISLPLSEESFEPERTRSFFEGLLPEGFTRRCVAERMHVDEGDYLSILAGLGSECLGAIKVIDSDKEEILPSYQKLSTEEVRNLAREGATESAQFVTKAHLSLTGASGKVGLYYDEKDGQWYLPVGDAPSTHIVKQSHVRLKNIVMNEQLCMMTAKKLGISVPDSFILNLGNAGEGDVLFATKRYDRMAGNENRRIQGLIAPYRLHQEDMAQAMGISSFYKYEHNKEGYLKRVFQILQYHSSDPITDQRKLWDMEIFNYLVGNTDNHIKNLSLVYGKNLKIIRLAPAYDIVSTTVYETSTRDMSISIDGKYGIDDITGNSFEREAKNVGLGTKMAIKRFDYLAGGFEAALRSAGNILEEQGFEGVETLIEKILETGGIGRL